MLSSYTTSDAPLPYFYQLVDFHSTSDPVAAEFATALWRRTYLALLALDRSQENHSNKYKFALSCWREWETQWTAWQDLLRGPPPDDQQGEESSGCGWFKCALFSGRIPPEKDSFLRCTGCQRVSRSTLHIGNLRELAH